MIALKNILVATDFGEAATSALAYGRDLARQYGATLHVFFAEDDLMSRYALDSPPIFTVNIQRDIEKAARERLEALLTDDDRVQLHARAAVTSSLSPSMAILDYAKAHAIDLIILGTHGRGAVSRLLMGSVAERVVRMAPCPVLTVRHPEREFLRPDAAMVTVSKA